MDVYVDGGLGADWLVVEGRNPLPSGSRILVDTVRERLVSHDVTATATVLGFESFRLVAFIGTDRALRFQFLGSDAPEIVHVFPSGRPFRFVRGPAVATTSSEGRERRLGGRWKRI